MEKIIIALNSHQLDKEAIRFACSVCKLTHSRLTGIFLNDVVVAEEVFIDQSLDESTVLRTYSIHPAEGELGRPSREVIDDFKALARESHVEAFVEIEEGIPAIDLISKTRYADLLIIDSRLSFSGVSELAPSRFVKDILQDSECPVMIAPQEARDIDTVIFCYYGSKSSLFAIKLFTYLFPQLKQLKAKVLDLNMTDGIGIHEQQEILRYLKYHYEDVEYINPGEEALGAFFNYLEVRGSELVVMGAYGRGLLDSFFNKDSESEKTKENHLPVLVAHY